LPAYALAAPYARQPLRRRASGLALALCINIALLSVLMTLGIVPAPQAGKALRDIVINFAPEQRSHPSQGQARVSRSQTSKPVPKPPPIILPVRPAIAPPPQATDKPTSWIEMSKADMAASDISKIPAAGGAGDSEIVGEGPNGEALYAAEWAREPSNAELAGYLPRRGIEGFGLVACKTMPANRVEDCVELDQTPGSRLASAVRQAAWQFRVRPPRKGGHALVGSWVRIRIDYINESGPNEDER
jgi:protein TonB